MASMAYDYYSLSMVLFGGRPTFDEGFLGDTWELGDSGWANIDLPVNPSPRAGQSMAFGWDVNMFGGFDSDLGPLPTDTWICYEGSWMSFEMTTNPEPRWSGAMISRSSEGTVLLIGGAYNAGTYGDIWEFPFTSSYVRGDANGDDYYNGQDIIYSVNYLKGFGPNPPILRECAGEVWYVACDVNASCSFNGLDITYGVSYFKGGPEPWPCPQCPD
jgi:hypothetical protein